MGNQTLSVCLQYYLESVGTYFISLFVYTKKTNIICIDSSLHALNKGHRLCDITVNDYLFLLVNRYINN
jgi:hypothetical protein